MSRSISLQLSDEDESRLDALSELTGRSTSFHVHEALEAYLNEAELAESIKREHRQILRGEVRTIDLETLEREYLGG